MKEIFISYSWSEKDITNKIYNDLTLVGLKINKDDKNLKYTDSLSEFMKSINDSDAAIILISENYLKSINCMYELLLVSKSTESIKEKVLPILNNAKIFSIEDRIELIKYWQDKYNKLRETISSIDLLNSKEIIEEVKIVKEISENISSVLGSIKDMLCITTKDLFDKSYNQIFLKVNANPDLTKMLELIPIANILNPHKRLKSIKNFVSSHKIETAACYSIIGSCYRDLNNKELAVENYKKAIELDNFNYAAWNNLGQVYELMFKNYDEAEKAYLKAIESNSKLDIPRLNLAILYKHHLKDEDKSLQLNKSILEFDENNAKAHNNIANFHRNGKNKNFDLFEKHVKIAISQNNIEAIINYGNYLKQELKQIELGNQYYTKAKELDKNGYYKEILELLIASSKG